MIIVSAKVFRTCHIFTPHRWKFHERVNTDEHRALDNVRVVRDRPKRFDSNNKGIVLKNSVQACVPTLTRTESKHPMAKQIAKPLILVLQLNEVPSYI